MLPASAATGVLVEAPRRIVGIELFPAVPVPYLRARYELAGVDLIVYYTEAGLPLPEDAATVQCGTRVLRVLEDPDLQVRVLEHGGETLIFAWDTDVAVDLCRILPSFLADFDFFRDALPGDRGSWLPATIE
ncbi:MAG: hypothetical protein EA383_06570 [Spirochaetaceae bacterium]|nr:MAG: hypothetical protein EA383_06570 [Spirochaetaceae bacterium]